MDLCKVIYSPYTSVFKNWKTLQSLKTERMQDEIEDRTIPEKVGILKVV